MSDEQDRNADVFPPGYLLAGRYEVDQLLGTGGMGSVYLARDRILASEQVAVKVLHKQLAFEKKYTQRFLREVQLMRKVNHPNVVRTFDVGTEGDTVYLTMEYARGRSLLSLVERRLLALEDLPEIAIQVGKGLQAIHDAGIIHRDLKPENVIVTDDGVAKITDFGVARTELSELTAHDEIIGSAAYMAPEVWSGEPLTVAVDIYAFGVILYELATSTLPFDADTPAALMRQHLDDAPVPPKNLNRAVPQWLNRLILRMLAKKPTERPKNSAEIVDIIAAEAARMTRRKLATEPSNVSTRESASLLHQLEEMTKKAADPKQTAAVTIERTEIAERPVKLPSSSFRLPLSRRSSAVFRPLRLGRSKLQEVLHWFTATCRGLPYFLTATALTLIVVGTLNYLTYPQSTDAATGSSVLDLLQTHSLRAAIVVAWLAIPIALLSAFSGRIPFILRISGISLLVQAILSFGLTFYQLAPVLDQGGLDGRAVSVAATAASNTLSEVALLAGSATTWSYAVLAQGLALHSPERHIVWHEWQTALPMAIYLCAFVFCFHRSARYTSRGAGVATIIALFWILLLLMAPSINQQGADWLGSPVVFTDSDLAMRLTGGVQIYWGSLLVWTGVYFILGVLSPVLLGPPKELDDY